jgi:large subunit ribosomal protein L24
MKQKSSPSKQRKFRYIAPLHIRGRFLNAHLSNAIRKKHNKRTMRVRKKDKVKVMKGQFKGKSGKVEDVDTTNFKVYIEGIEIQKKDGTKVKYPIAIPNIMITELNLDDRKRQALLKRK